MLTVSYTCTLGVKNLGRVRVVFDLLAVRSPLLNTPESVVPVPLCNTRMDMCVYVYAYIHDTFESVVPMSLCSTRMRVCVHVSEGVYTCVCMCIEYIYIESVHR